MSKIVSVKSVLASTCATLMLTLTAGANAGPLVLEPIEPIIVTDSSTGTSLRCSFNHGTANNDSGQTVLDCAQSRDPETCAQPILTCDEENPVQ